MTTPAIFMSHGPGPAWLLGEEETYHKWKGLGIGKESKEATYLKNLLSSEGITKPKCLLVISAHFETEKNHVVTSHTQPPMIYDLGSVAMPDVAYQVRLVLIDLYNLYYRTERQNLLFLHCFFGNTIAYTYGHLLSYTD